MGALAAGRTVEVSHKAGAGAREERVRRGVWVRARGTRRVRGGGEKRVMYDREPLAVACARLSIEANGFGDHGHAEVSIGIEKMKEARAVRRGARVRCFARGERGGARG